MCAKKCPVANDNYKKTRYVMNSNEDHICKEFGSMEEAKNFIKQHKDRLLN